MSEHLGIIDPCRRVEGEASGPPRKRCRPDHTATCKAREFTSAHKFAGRDSRTNQPLAPTLARAFEGRYPHRVLAALGATGPSLLPDLVPALRDPDDRVRTAAAFTLAYMGTDALPAALPLTDALRDSVDDVRWAA